MKFAPVAVVLLLALAGCGGGAPADGTPTSAPPSPSATSGGGGEAAPACTRDDVSISYAATDNTAGQMHGVLSITNTAPSPCTMQGYPVVYLGSGEVEGPVGQPAAEDDSAVPALITLQPGNVAGSNLTITQAGNLEGCDLASTTHLIAGPPVDHPFEWELDGQHVDIPETPICSNDDIGLLTVSPLVLAAA